MNEPARIGVDRRRRWRGRLPERRVLAIAVALLSVIALLPVWSFRFLPMQDYPVHLFVAHVLRSFDQAQWNWAEHYVRDARLAPYSLYFFLMYGLALFWKIETAGRIVVSTYVVLTSFFVLREIARRRGDEQSPLPWALLLFFPLLFNPIYYMGFQGYLLTIPLLLFGLRGVESIADARPGTGFLIGQGLLVIVLFWLHPYASMAFAGLGMLGALSRWRRPAAMARASIPPLASLLLVFVWIGSSGLGAEGGANRPLVFWPLKDNLAYLSMTFTGMRITQSPSLRDVVIWCAAGSVLLVAAFRRSTGAASRGGFLTLVQAAFCFAVLLALPFGTRSGFGAATYLNLRAVPLLLLLLVLAASNLVLHAWQKGVVAAASLLAMWTPLEIHRGVSEEVGELLPLLAEMEPNQNLMPVYQNAGSDWLDPVFFYQFHSHEHDYYHVLVGGGASPDLFDNSLLPIRYSPGFSLRVDPEGARLRDDYRYLLVRGTTRGSQSIERGVVAARSGHWRLLDLRARTDPSPARGETGGTQTQ